MKIIVANILTENNIESKNQIIIVHRLSGLNTTAHPKAISVILSTGSEIDLSKQTSLMKVQQVVLIEVINYTVGAA